jgi:hypothetical protein
MPRPRKVEPARFLRWIDPNAQDTINDLKALTWESAREHAIVLLRGGKHALLCGGSHGMTLEIRTGAIVGPSGDRLQYPCVEVNAQPIPIERLVCHTHPAPTGPSEADFRVLELLRQEESMLYEIGGPAEGTKFRNRNKAMRG